MLFAAAELGAAFRMPKRAIPPTGPKPSLHKGKSHFMNQAMMISIAAIATALVGCAPAANADSHSYTLGYAAGSNGVGRMQYNANGLTDAEGACYIAYQVSTVAHGLATDAGVDHDLPDSESDFTRGCLDALKKGG
jgi:hypothetical protein